MNNFINSIGIATSLLTGEDTTDHKKVTETDLITQVFNINPTDYIKEDFKNTKDNKYVTKTYYEKNQSKKTKQLKARRIQEQKRIERKKEAKRQLEIRLQLKRQQELEYQRELAKQRQIEYQKLEEVKQQSYKREAVAKTKLNTSSAQNSTTEQSVGTLYNITYYTAFCSEGCTGVTASGHNVSGTNFYNGMRIVAADSSIPLYTKLKITYANGKVENAIVLDRGGAIKGNILDVLVSTDSEARSLGRTTAKVQIIK